MPFWKKTDKGGKKKPPKSAVPRTAQQSIPMQRMFEDGTCRVKPNYYTRTIAYQDINYQLAQQEDKTAIFEEWCSFLNFFDSSIKFELSFVNMATDSTEFEKSIRIPYQKDGFDDVRAEYSQMLRQQLAKGNNGLTKTKFITFGVEGESMAQVKPRLDHIQNDLLNNFHRLGVQAKPLNGVQRLKLMHDMFNMDGASKFHFDWKDLVKSGLSVKDAIAPTAFAFKNSRTFQMGGIFCAASFLSITASDISDQLLKDFLDMDSSQIVTMHIQSVDQNRAIKTVKRTITELDRSKIEEQKKAIRAGYDIDIIPSDLATYGRDAKALLKELQSQNERMFLVTFLVLNTGRTEQELENNVFQASSIAQKHNCNLCRLDFQQEQGLMSSLPLADCQIEIQRGLTTSSTAIFIPFTTQELYQSGKESLYYGLNALSNNLIMVDRKKLKNPNGLILGTPGSGKSFSAKREIANAFLVLNTGRTEQELENNVFQASSIAQKHNCNLCRLDFQQEQGLMSSLPLADCQIEIQRGLTTSSTAIFIPFTTQELYQSGKESLYYGLNALSNNLIMVDRKKLKNPNGLILGTPGSGKSFSAKREIANAFLVTDDDIIINDPEGEVRHEVA